MINFMAVIDREPYHSLFIKDIMDFYRGRQSGLSDLEGKEALSSAHVPPVRVDNRRVRRERRRAEV